MALHLAYLIVSNNPLPMRLFYLSTSLAAVAVGYGLGRDPHVVAASGARVSLHLRWREAGGGLYGRGAPRVEPPLPAARKAK